jgi:23S rRNA (pseudouridine1915-N3)-methyltransferase
VEIAVLAVGRLKSGPESELAVRYLDRARKTGRGLGFRGFEVQELAEARGARAADRIVQEEEALLAALSKSAGSVVCLDAGGELADSESFAAELRRDAEAGAARTVFVIGGPDGLGDKILARAARRLSFGRLTWPHQIVRILLAEQLYRAMTILSGHPYHRP